MRINGKKIATVLVLLALVAGGGILIQRKKARLAAAPAPTAQPTLVQVATARLGRLDDSRTYLARVEPSRTTTLAAQLTARILRLRPHEGDTVQQGELLAELDSAELTNGLAAARADLAALEKTARYWQGENDRDQMLAKEGAISRAVAAATADRASSAQGRYQAQKRRCDELTARLAHTRLNAPFSGVISRRLAEPGDLAAPGKPLLVIEDQQRRKLVFDVPQEDLAGVEKADEIHYSVAGQPRTLRISRRYPSLNPDRTLRLEAEGGAVPLPPSGSYLPVSMTIHTIAQAVLVPEVCLLPAPDGATAVFTVEAGKTVPHRVTVLLRQQGLAAVSGIAPGAQVVRSSFLGWNRLAAGEAVEARP